MGLFDIADHEPDRVLAVDDRGRKYYYGQILEIAEQTAPVTAGELVFVLAGNTPGILLTYLALLKNRAVPVLLPTTIPPDQLGGLFRRYHPSCVLYTDADTGTVRRALSAAAGKEPGGIRRCEESILASTGFSSPQLHRDLALLLPTSGSTGSPKLVRLSRQNLEANTASIISYLQIDEKERPITPLKLSYSYGMSIIHTHVQVGATILLTDCGLLDKTFWKRAVGECATSLSGVPYSYEMMRRLRVQDMYLPALKVLTQAGGKLPQDLQREVATWCEKTGRRFYVMYGQTEASPRMGYLPYQMALKKPGSMGIAIPGGHFHLETEEGETIQEAEQTGELVYQGENVSMGYATCDKDLKKGDERGGVLHTGDMAWRDEDGYYYIVGRKARFIKLLGVRVSLDAVEQFLQKTWPESDFAVTGSDGDLRIYTDNPSQSGDEVEKLLNTTYAWPLRLIHVLQIHRIPRTEGGKIRYKELP
ncbi:MAG: AMP-binding protein [Bilifractor sp.]